METLQALAVVGMRQKNFAMARDALEAALALDQPIRYRRPLLFSLARARDALGDAEGAMTALAEAHSAEASDQIQHEGSGLEGSGLLALVESRFTATTQASWSDEDAPAEIESPVFVVGFPRSGTTLLEQMLAAHSAFESADEQPMLQRALEHLRGFGIEYPQGLASVSTEQRESLRASYWQESRRTVTLQPGQRLVDKHPLNFLALPLIRFLFPNSPVIFCRRHPCDSLLSSFMQDFRDPRLARECASLDRLTNLYVRLAQRWNDDTKLFPERILISRHEDLIDDPDQHLQQIGRFLGVEDSKAMLDFGTRAKARGFIGTPSYAQVVEAINPDVAGRWRRYANHLEPVLPKLAPIIENWGYEV